MAQTFIKLIKTFKEENHDQSSEPYMVILRQITGIGKDPAKIEIIFFEQLKTSR